MVEGLPDQTFIHFAGRSGVVYLTLGQFLKERLFPEHLFKYRTWFGKDSIGNKEWYDWSWLYERQVYMSDPFKFEDTEEFKNFSKWDELSLLERSSIVALNVQEEFSAILSPIEVAKTVDWIEKKGHLQSKEYSTKMIEKAKIQFSERIGICSFTKSQTKQTLWDKYSNSDSGFCIRFNSAELFRLFGGGGYVSYPEGELPKAKPHPLHNYDVQADLLIYHKEKKWKFEDEYRTIILKEVPLNHTERIIVAPPSAYHSVIVGRNCDKFHFMEIREAVEAGIGPIKDEKEDLLGRIQLFL